MIKYTRKFLRLFDVIGQVSSIVEYFSGGNFSHANKHVYGGGFTCPVRPEKPEYFGSFHIEVNAINAQFFIPD